MAEHFEAIFNAVRECKVRFAYSPEVYGDKSAQCAFDNIRVVVETMKDRDRISTKEPTIEVALIA